MTAEERELLTRLFEAYALMVDVDSPLLEHFKVTFDAALRADIVDESRRLPGPRTWERIY